MATTRFYFDGLEELRNELKVIPYELQTEAGRIAEAEANAAAVAIRRVYAQHVASGRLLRGLVVERKGAARWQVRSKSPLAWIFDHGSQARHWKTRGGRSTGQMWGQTPNPPTFTFARATLAGAEAMKRQLKELLLRKGFLVRGDAA